MLKDMRQSIRTKVRYEIDFRMNLENLKSHLENLNQFNMLNVLMQKVGSMQTDG